MMVVFVSRSGWCTVTARYDRAAITDVSLFAQCLQEGFRRCSRWQKTLCRM